METRLTELIRRYRSGDPHAAEALARRAGDSALRTAAAALGDLEIARDVAQEVAIDALRSLDRLRNADRFDAWVHRIAVRRVSRAIGERMARRAERSLDELGDGSEPAAAPNPAMEAEAIARRDALARAMEDLPTQQRIALALRYVHDLSEPEIAAAMGVRPGTAGSLLSRGRETLRTSPLLHDFAPATHAGGAS